MGGGTVIRGFLQILGPQRGRMYSYLAVATIYGVLHGLAMVLLVPISVALFDADYAAAGRWLGLLASSWSSRRWPTTCRPHSRSEWP
jgi:hypothetical protein